MWMAAIEIHTNSCLPELVYRVPIQCQTRTHVYVNSAQSRVHSKLKGQNSRTFQGQNCSFQVPNVSIKWHIIPALHQNLEWNIYFSVLTNTALMICDTQWEIVLSKQVNYNQVMVKCQILQECFLQNFNMHNFQNMEHSNSRTFQGLSRAWNFLFKIQGFSRTSQWPYEPW